ncbi:hypothetical protein HWV62_41537 [Athelia sp. TMB]|nr:hypothetical protein HWV62_17176 [Athelia sp. TMB]KAF7986107.1 hypothetical protein HWV62_41537 [Athelia sp. TMB]
MQSLRVPWQYKDYFRTDFELSPSCTAPIQHAVGLAQSFSMKASHLTGVRATDALYVPPRGATLQSAVFLQESVADKAGCGAAYMQYGTGWLGYSGDNNTEGGSTKLQLAMCGLGLEDCTLTDQTTANGATRGSFQGPSGQSINVSYSGVAGINNPDPDPGAVSIATDVDFWMRPAWRVSNDASPRQSRWDRDRNLSMPSIP